MRELRRSRAGPFVENRSYNLHQLSDAKARMMDGNHDAIRTLVRPIEEAFEYVPTIFVRDSAVDAICHGADLAVPGVVKLDSQITNGQAVALFTLKSELVALAIAKMNTQHIVDNERGIAAKTIRVIMERGTYPPLWREQLARSVSKSLV
jgi:H/ACA ribonucleoprotein complex subunit 4